MNPGSPVQSNAGAQCETCIILELDFTIGLHQGCPLSGPVWDFHGQDFKVQPGEEES